MESIANSKTFNKKNDLNVTCEWNLLPKKVITEKKPNISMANKPFVLHRI